MIYRDIATLQAKGVDIEREAEL
ncbi:hypothetical protein AAEU31_18870 [Pseudoalteromonas sp. SSMSWG5]